MRAAVAPVTSPTDRRRRHVRTMLRAGCGVGQIRRYLAGCRLMHLLERAPWIPPRSNAFDDLLVRFYASQVFSILGRSSRLMAAIRGIRPRLGVWRAH